MDSESASSLGEDSVASGAVPLGQRFMIHPAELLPDLGLPGTPAYAATDARAPGAALYALVASPALPARLETMAALKGARASGLVPLVDFGPVVWPLGGDVRIAALFEVPEGGPLVPRGKEPVDPVPPHRIVDSVLRPLIGALDEIFQRNLTHRAVRPTNLFFRDRERRRIVLGPGVAAPPALHQPAEIEPIESALCDPLGRGEGARADDLFALGATLVALMQGGRSAAGDPVELLTERIERGSYAALLGELGVPESLAECLRGLLTDLPSERWSLDTVKRWLDGQRGPSPMGAAAPRADRPFVFANREIANTRSLAQAMSKDAKTAFAVLQEPRIERWLRSGLKDGKRADAFASFREGLLAAARQNSDGTTIARALMMLDPEAPIRYRGITTHPDGIGTVLAAGFDRPEIVQAVGELLRLNLIGAWLNLQTRLPKSVVGSLGGLAQRLARWVGDGGFGRGIERCLYELNPDLPCRSPLVAAEWVADPADLLPALDRAAQDADHDGPPVDRHIAAFVLARAGVDADRLAALLASARNPGELALGTAKLLAWMQKRYCAPALPHLAQWLARHLLPAVELYRHRPLRTLLKERLSELAPRGDLDALTAVIDNESLRREDALRFARATAEYSDLTKKIQELAHTPAGRLRRAVALGHQAATLIAGAVCIVSVAVALIGLAP